MKLITLLLALIITFADVCYGREVKQCTLSSSCTEFWIMKQEDPMTQIPTECDALVDKFDKSNGPTAADAFTFKLVPHNGTCKGSGNWCKIHKSETLDPKTNVWSPAVLQSCVSAAKVQNYGLYLGCYGFNRTVKAKDVSIKILKICYCDTDFCNDDSLLAKPVQVNATGEIKSLPLTAFLISGIAVLLSTSVCNS